MRVNMITLRIHTSGSEVLLAAADKDLLDMKFSEGKMKLEVYREFYEGEDASEEILLNRLSMCTSANLVGEKVIALAVKHKYIDEERIITIGGVPHAQLAKM